MQGRRREGIPDLSGEHMAEPLPCLRRRRAAGFGRLPSSHRQSPSRYLEGLKSHKARLAILILDDEERAPIFIEGEGPDRRHGAAAVATFPRPAESAPEPRARLPLAGGRHSARVRSPGARDLFFTRD